MYLKKKLLCLVALVLVLAAAFAFTVMADEIVYTGDIDIVRNHLALVDSAATSAEKVAAEAELNAYLKSNAVDPTVEGYDEVMKQVGAVRITVVTAFVTEIETLPSAEERAKLLDELDAYLHENPIDSTNKDNEELIAKIKGLPKSVAAFYLDQIDAVGTGFDKEVLSASLEEYLKKRPLDAEADAELITRVNAIPEKIVCAYAAELDTAADTAAMLEIFGKSDAYIAAHPVEAPSESYTKAKAKLDTAHLTCANGYLAEIDPELGLAENGIKVRTLGSFLKNYPVNPELEGYTELAEAYAKAKLAHEEAKADARAKLVGETTFVEYSYTTHFNNDFDGNGFGKFIAGNASSGGMKAHVGEDKGKDGDNGYATVNYPFKSHVYARVDFPHQPNNFVVDFDITSFGMTPKIPMRAENGSITVNEATGKKIGPGYFYIMPDGSFTTGESATENTMLLEGACIKDEWFHITLVVHTDTHVIDYYGDYEFLGSYEIGGTQGYDYQLTHFRMGCTGADENIGAEFQLDNFQLYEGSRLRDVNYVNNMTEDELFKFHASGLNLPGVSFKVINNSYKYLTSNLFKYYEVNSNGSGSYLTNDAELIAAVNTYLAFDYDSVVAWIQAENLETYLSMVEDVLAIERTPATLEQRQEAFDSLQEFLDSNNGLVLIDQRYTDASAKVAVVEAQLKNENVINDFIANIDRFYSTSNAEALAGLYETITALIPQLETELLEDDNYYLFQAAYAKVPMLKETLEDTQAIDRTKRFIAAMDFISEYDTEEEWDENYDYINKYIAIAREVYREGIDVYYKNAADALEFYSAINAHYFDRVQADHIAYLEERLDAYDKTVNFVEKYGICNDIRFYAEKNDLDENNARIAELLAKADGYYAKLLLDLENYNAIIEENTVKFLSAMSKLTDSSDFNAKVAIYNEAEKYYGTMNVSDEAAAEARETFKALGAEITEVRADTQRFIDAVALLPGYKAQDDLYDALIGCFILSAEAEEQIDGCTEAMQDMNSALTEYRQNVNTVNSELSETRDAASNSASLTGGKAANAFN